MTWGYPRLTEFAQRYVAAIAGELDTNFLFAGIEIGDPRTPGARAEFLDGWVRMTYRDAAALEAGLGGQAPPEWELPPRLAIPSEQPRWPLPPITFDDAMKTLTHECAHALVRRRTLAGLEPWPRAEMTPDKPGARAVMEAATELIACHFGPAALRKIRAPKIPSPWEPEGYIAETTALSLLLDRLKGSTGVTKEAVLRAIAAEGGTAEPERALMALAKVIARGSGLRPPHTWFAVPQLAAALGRAFEPIDYPLDDRRTAAREEATGAAAGRAAIAATDVVLRRFGIRLPASPDLQL